MVVGALECVAGGLTLILAKILLLSNVTTYSSGSSGADVGIGHVVMASMPSRMVSLVRNSA